MPSQVNIYHDFMRGPSYHSLDGAAISTSNYRINDMVDCGRRSSLSFTKSIFYWGCRRRCRTVGQFLHKYLSKKFVILRQILGYFGSLDLTLYSEKVLQTTACRHNPACEAISSGFKCILSLIRKLCFQDKFVNLVECNIFRNNHIT